MADPVFRRHRKTNLVLYHEATPGTPGANGHLIPLVTRTFGIIEERGSAKRRPADFNPVRTMRGFFKAEGNAETVAEVTHLGMMLHKCFGAAAISGGPVYLHKFDLNDEPGSVTVQEVDADAAKGNIANNVKVVGMSFSAGKEANEASFVWDLLGTGQGTKNAALIDAAPTTYVGDIFPLSNVGVKLDGSLSSFITKVELGLKRFGKVPMTCNGLRYGSWVITGGFEVSVSVTGVWASDGTNDICAELADDEAEHSLSIELALPSPGTDTLSLKFPEMHFFVTSVPALGSDDGEREITLDGNAYFENAAEASAFQAALSCATADFGALWTA